jgi:hypothetical protein
MAVVLCYKNEPRTTARRGSGTWWGRARQKLLEREIERNEESLCAGVFVVAGSGALV